MSKTITCVDIYGKEHEVPVSELTWRPSAYAIVIKDDRILLSKQFGNGYDLPGGGVDLGELLEDAVIRETKEETGIDVANPRLITAENSFFTFTHSGGGSIQSLQFFYKCDFVGGEFSIDGFDEYEKQYADMPEWIPLNELPNIIVKSSIDWREVVKKVL